MKIYAALSRIFPESFTAKIFVVAFLGIHAPLLAVVAWILLDTGSLAARLDIILVALAATLAGTAVTLVCLRALLAPLFRAEETMRLYEETGTAECLPGGYRDAVGRIMARTNRLVLHVTDQVALSRRAAIEDPLTGLLNRRGFEEKVSGGRSGLMLMVDLDHFKQVNDRFGHGMGDAVLRAAADQMRQAVRSADTVARHGGEEFLAFLPDTDAEEASAIADRVRAAIEANVRAGSAPVTASVGVARHEAGQPLTDAIARADRSVYAAKMAGRNRICFDRAS